VSAAKGEAGYGNKLKRILRGEASRWADVIVAPPFLVEIVLAAGRDPDILADPVSMSFDVAEIWSRPDRSHVNVFEFQGAMKASPQLPWNATWPFGSM
jgi:hypothetical protein